ncbi:hypothetical protein BR63_13240 [Thermanaerosceptrum fracticalcis]|uniref:ABC-2 type transporter transmembrane domain-containing protein n=1 Tax=Thermanaerosceptrum fracticalcis TaxID=1712410 RepID=A0A7G6E527_THEFR|nr:ABC transporter permease [Thermanaerosceptrum fracticalcis]QNB47181.1 hypothetical protein BR63_13240 [Thermanaerosceptrum fracticalcis]
MAKGLLSLLALDAKLLWRNKYVHITLALAVTLVILIKFVVPGELKVGTVEYFFDDTEGRIFHPSLKEHVPAERIKASEEELRRTVRENSSSVGIILRGARENPRAVIIRQGHEPDTAINLLAVSLDEYWRKEGGLAREDVAVTTYLRPQAAKIEFNRFLLPVFVAMDVVFLGFVFAAVMIFQEKNEGSLRAYRVSPGDSLEFILSKVLVNSALALAYGLFLVGLVQGSQARYLELALLLVIAGSMMSLLGMFLGVFFSNLSSFIYPLFVVSTILGLPLASYFFPAFNLPFFQYIPTYHILFGLREILFPTGRPDLVWSELGKLCLPLAVFALCCYLAVERRLMREVK